MELYWNTDVLPGSFAWEPPYVFVFNNLQDEGKFIVLDLDTKKTGIGHFVDAEDIHLCDISEEDVLEIEYPDGSIIQSKPSFDFVIREGGIAAPGVMVVLETPSRWMIKVPDAQVVVLNDSSIVDEPIVLQHNGKYHILTERNKYLVIYRF